MPKLTRRSLFAVGGAGVAGLAVSGCASADDPRTEGRDGEILDSAAKAEADFYAVFTGIEVGTKVIPVIDQFKKASHDRLDELDKLGAKVTTGSTENAPLTSAIAAASPAIAAYRDIVKLGSTPELRSTAIQFLTQVSAEQATLRGLGGEDQSPQPFVTGLAEKPYVATDDNADTTSTTSTSSTTTSTPTTTSSTGDGG
jgi:hypothetical protein